MGGRLSRSEDASLASRAATVWQRRSGRDARAAAVDTRAEALVSSLVSRCVVTPPNVSVDDVACRFGATAVPERGTDADRYFDSLISTGLVDEMNLAAPGMIGHMSGSVPYWGPALAKAIHQMNLNVVKTETAKVRSKLLDWTLAPLLEAQNQRHHSHTRLQRQ